MRRGNQAPGAIHAQAIEYDGNDKPFTSVQAENGQLRPRPTLQRSRFSSMAAVTTSACPSGIKAVRPHAWFASRASSCGAGFSIVVIQMFSSG